jgi:hypothetical protein
MRRCLEKISNILLNNDVGIVRTLQLYFVKYLKSKLQINTSQFKELLIKELSEKLQWIKHCEII